MAGNHDLVIDLESERAKEIIPDNVTFLKNEGIMIEGVQFFGLTARPWMHEVAPVPEYIEVLLSHGPPMGILDENTGCTILRKMVGILKPTVHLFGHIHSVG
jgi:Icc-related predicted phosphoesterase